MSPTLNALGLLKWPVSANTTPVLSACLATFQAVIFMVMVILITKRLSSPQKLNQGKGSNKRAPLPPGPVPWPVIGSVPDMRRNKPAFRWIHRFMKENNTNIACFRLGNTHVIPVTCPKIAREFLKNQDTIFQSRSLLSFASYTFSRGFLSAAFAPYGDQWKKMRRVLTTEIICTARQQWMHDKRAEEADNLVKYVHNQSKNSANVDLRIVTRCYTGNVIRKLLFGKRYFGEPMPDGSPGVDEIEHVEALFTSLIHVNAFCISDFLPRLLGLDLDGHEKIVKEAKQTIDKYHDPVIDERINQWRDGNSNGKEVEDFLDVLITLKDNNGQPLLTTEEIKAQCWELMVAAVDNPANAVEWILGEMVNQPEILQKAVEEIDSVVGKDRLVQESDIPKLNYTKACIREGFRLHPVAPFNIPHVALTDTTVAGYFIPKGSHVILSRYGLGRNPDVWDEPTKFKPERHLKECLEVALTEHDLRFISFSTGRRGCVAASLGTLMTTMLLARLVQGFTWNAPGKASHVDLSEAEAELFLAKPLKLRAVPRLPQHLYPTAN